MDDSTHNKDLTSSDSPRTSGTSLIPSAQLILSLPARSDAEAPQGTTIRNGPGEAPDRQAMAEYHAEQAQRSLTENLQADIGAAQSAAGRMPGHFNRFRLALRAAVSKTSIDASPQSTAVSWKTVASLLAPGAPSIEAADKVAQSPMGRAVHNQAAMLPNVDDQRFRESGMQLMAAAEGAKERLSAVQLRTVVELTHDPSGAIADISVREKSGDDVFDESVMHLSRKVSRTLPDDDERGLGAHWWRSKWMFTLGQGGVYVELMQAYAIDTPR